MLRLQCNPWYQKLGGTLPLNCEFCTFSSSFSLCSNSDAAHISPSWSVRMSGMLHLVWHSPALRNQWALAVEVYSQCHFLRSPVSYLETRQNVSLGRRFSKGFESVSSNHTFFMSWLKCQLYNRKLHESCFSIFIFAELHTSCFGL